jgi:delta-aminolevulinic acid dehydratase/porphobilinogen synthase
MNYSQRQRRKRNVKYSQNFVETKAVRVSLILVNYVINTKENERVCLGVTPGLKGYSIKVLHIEKRGKKSSKIGLHTLLMAPWV